MQYGELGPLKVSALGNEAESIATIHRAIELGI